jgi:glycosyltransferase involved in cell wall biosynthesis
MKRSLVVTDARVWNAEAEYALSVANAEASLGGEVIIAAAAGSPVAAHVRPPLLLFDLPGVEPSRSPADFFANVRELSGLVSRRSFDVVHSSLATAHLEAALAGGRRAPLVHLRGGAGEPSGHAGNRFLYNTLTEAVVASSSRVAAWVVERLGVPRERVARILAPVDDRYFEDRSAGSTLPAELGIDPGAEMILNVARLAPVKGHDVLIEAMVIVHERFPGARLVLVGEPWSGQPDGLRQQARRLGVEEAVVFAGRRDDIPRLLAGATVCVSSSIGSEENSRAVGEYMASGKPVVATAVGVIPELVVDGVTGLLVPPRNHAALASGLSDVLGEPARAQQMGLEGRRVATESFSSGAFRAKLDALLGSVGPRRSARGVCGRAL